MTASDGTQQQQQQAPNQQYDQLRQAEQYAEARQRLEQQYQYQGAQQRLDQQYQQQSGSPSTSALLQEVGVGGTPSSVQEALQRAIGYTTAPSPWALPNAPLGGPAASNIPNASGGPPAMRMLGGPVGPQGDTAAQLRAGFTAAGRQDLANMVGTPAFNAWINAESGGRPNAVSAANNQGRPNGGLFQFWAGHQWAQPYFQGGQFTMSPYQQAMAAAQYFHLTPAHIQAYAQQIAAHQYRGWG